MLCVVIFNSFMRCFWFVDNVFYIFVNKISVLFIKLVILIYLLNFVCLVVLKLVIKK